MDIYKFNYNGFYGTVSEKVAPFTAEFVEWTRDPGIFVANCSDGKQRLIPTFAIVDEASYVELPEQPLDNMILFGPASSSE